MPASSTTIRWVRRPGRIVLLVAAGAVATACGGGGSSGAASSATAPPPGRPALARAPKRPGEIVVSAQVSPQSHGPFALDGRYVARFEQIAPEDSELDFGRQTPFVAMLDRAPEQEGAGSVRLFRAAAKTGRRTVTLHGRWYLDVSFGDFPYAIRLTPVARR
jgi:hypothetical protein